MRMIGFPSIKLSVSSLTDLKRRKAAIKEPETVAWLQDALRHEGPFTLLDIGANIGGYSLIACALDERCKAVAVEPFPPTFKTLCRNIINNGWHERILPINGFFGDQNALPAVTMVFNGWTSGIAEHPQSGRLSLRLPVYNYSSLCRFLPATERLLCKIDVDGGEFSVLSGMAELLRRNQLRSVLIECFEDQQQEIGDILRQAGLSGLKVFRKVNQKQVNMIASRDAAF